MEFNDAITLLITDQAAAKMEARNLAMHQRVRSMQHKAPAKAENFSTTGEVRLMYG